MPDNMPCKVDNPKRCKDRECSTRKLMLDSTPFKVDSPRRYKDRTFSTHRLMSDSTPYTVVMSNRLRASCRIFMALSTRDNSRPHQVSPGWYKAMPPPLFWRVLP